MTLLDKSQHLHSQADPNSAKSPEITSDADDGSWQNPPATNPATVTPRDIGSVPGPKNVPLPQDKTRPHPQYQSQMQNAGISAGAVVGAMGEGSMVGDMMVGGVVGGIVGQRVAQAQNHAFYRDQAMQYREGRANGTIPPPEEVYEGSSKSWWSKEGRAQRRAERWERRAKRAGEI